MAEVFLFLPKKEQSQILRKISMNSGVERDALLLEKDIWVCWALDILFKMPSRLPMAFKGGTSLSKVYSIINRFSEDVDITIDYNALGSENIYLENMSKTKIKKIGLQTRLNVTKYLEEKIIPYFKGVISEQFKENEPSIFLDKDGETVHLQYPSVVERRSGYITDSVRLEFGGRNSTTPNENKIITADISRYLDGLLFPIAEVTVLSPEKTFWEKITLIHYECNRPFLKENANRISRHWYDISMLAQHEIGRKAILNRALLSDVIRIKKTFYDSTFARYDDCLNGKIRLIPNDGTLKWIEEDFREMLSNKMFYGEQPEFENVIEELRELEKSINKSN